MSAIYDKKSYLRNTTTRRFYLDVAKLPSTAGVGGKTVVVPPECENRIDLFAFQQYGSSRYWWMIALANADIIRDPLWDFHAGMVVFVPDSTKLSEEAYSLR